MDKWKSAAPGSSCSPRKFVIRRACLRVDDIFITDGQDTVWRRALYRIHRTDIVAIETPDMPQIVRSRESAEQHLATNDIDNLKIVGGSLLNENNCLATNAAFALRGGPYCPVYKLPRVAYHSLSAEIEAGDRFSFLVGVSNLFDKKPPLVSTVGAPISAFAQVPELASYYDYLGRRLFALWRPENVAP